MSRHATPTADERSVDPIEPDDVLESSGSSPVSGDADEAGPASDPSLPSGAGSGASTRRRLRGSLPLAALILGAALAVVGSLFWWDAVHDPQIAAAGDRDQALIEGTSAIETLNSLDYRDVAAGFAGWAEVTTGLMRDQISAADETQRQAIADQQKIAVADVTDAALLRLDGEEATVLAAITITVTDDAVPDSEPVPKRNRFTAELRLVDGTWLVESLQQVAVNLS